MKSQEIFDKVSIHLLEQNEKAFRHGECVYFDPSTEFRCAVGFMLPPGHEAGDFIGGVYELVEEYPDLLEAWGIWHHAKASSLPSEEINILQNLQNVHDTRPACNWRRHLIDVGNKFHLNTSKVIHWSKA